MSLSRDGRSRLRLVSYPLRRSGHSRLTGQSLVEFALIAPLFFFLLWVVVDGAWFVFEVSAVSNSATQAVRWEIAVQNWCANQPTCLKGSQYYNEPYCDQPGPDNIPLAMVQAAEAGAGPFASSVAVGMDNTVVTDTASGTAVIGCTVRVSVPFSPLADLIHFGPSTISSTATADLVSS